MNTITTYADGFGRWHALVPMSLGSRGQLSRAARKAIQSELDQRSGPNDVIRFRVTLINHDGTTAHYAEVV